MYIVRFYPYSYFMHISLVANLFSFFAVQSFFDFVHFTFNRRIYQRSRRSLDKSHPLRQVV